MSLKTQNLPYKLKKLHIKITYLQLLNEKSQLLTEKYSSIYW